MTAQERAIAELRAGRPLEAEAIVAAAVREAEQAHGAQSPQYAAAQFDLASVLVGVGDLARAAQAMRRAADVPAKDDPARKLQLTYLMNLGEVLQHLGQLPEARAVLEEGLRGREAFYGANTEGHAFGQEALADLLLAQGELEPAEAMIERALATLWKAGNPRAVMAVALRAAVRAARYGGERPLLEAFDALPPPLRAELASACLMRAEHDAPPAALEVLLELRERFDDLPEERGNVPQLVAAIANVARVAKAHPQRLEALEWLRAHFEKQADAPQELNAWQALALAQDEAGLAEKAEETYRQAAARCQGLPAALHSQVLRNFGLFLSERGRKDEAEPMLARAVEVGEASGDRMMLGRALVARGIFVQHAARLEEAQALLERALQLVPSAHPDALCAQSHLDAIRDQRACGCGDMRGALSKALEEMVRAGLPEGLLRSISIRSVENLALEVSLTRSPTPEEQDLLNRVIHQAVARLREGVRQGGQAG